MFGGHHIQLYSVSAAYPRSSPSIAGARICAEACPSGLNTLGELEELGSPCVRESCTFPHPTCRCATREWARERWGGQRASGHEGRGRGGTRLFHAGPACGGTGRRRARGGGGAPTCVSVAGAPSASASRGVSCALSASEPTKTPPCAADLRRRSRASRQQRRARRAARGAGGGAQGLLPSRVVVSAEAKVEVRRLAGRRGGEALVWARARRQRAAPREEAPQQRQRLARHGLARQPRLHERPRPRPARPRRPGLVCHLQPRSRR